jgi:tripartite-type tricarboxylate transporter receptor subunit TctC
MHCRVSDSVLTFPLAWVIVLLFNLGPVFGQTQAPFYQGKTITVLQGREPGGTGDSRARAVTQFLQKYIPGNPTIIHEFMAGGGGNRAANHMYAVAKPDGLTIGSVSSGMLSSAILGSAGVKYQFEKFHYLGAADAGGHYVLYTRKEAGASNLEKLRAASGIRIGAQSVGHSNYNLGRLAAYLLPLKEARLVTGYASPEIDAAVLRGELDARFNQSHTIFRAAINIRSSPISPSWKALPKTKGNGSSCNCNAAFAFPVRRLFCRRACRASA